ncbi:guanylate kinase [Acidovorax sp. PRC11]|uniref:guanylate kinase n=1 Tax=Acidovorax sp. PRC11 TaxID=2962592 RepID=UPI002880EBAF|nr:guanylate kinase [Acidovorax sp. PRC11]MDT0140340.1 guanylate kinase [Acidovorax sp. PRC11]
MHKQPLLPGAAPNVSFEERPTSTFFVVSGPGGTGKTTLIKRWLRDSPDLGYVPNVTTRAPRASSAVDESGFYEFVSRQEFQEMVKAEAFAQWVNPSEGKYYGTPIKPLQEAIVAGKDLVFDYTPQLYINLRRQFREQVVGIFVIPPTFEELLSRLERRGTERGEELYIKQQMALQDLSYVDEHEYHLVNKDLDCSLEVLKAIRTAERHRLTRLRNVGPNCKKLSPRSMMFYYDPLFERVNGIAQLQPQNADAA